VPSTKEQAMTEPTATPEPEVPQAQAATPPSVPDPVVPAAPPIPPPSPAAGVPVYPDGKPMLTADGQPASPKSRLVAALLAWFLGVLGVHRFYVGKNGTGIAIILTIGGFFGIWPLIDFIMILLGSFKDKQERILSNW
jgi:TM2 domain-containing membrane protein YozV